MRAGWTDFFVTIGGAAAALTGLLFVAVALRPSEIRGSTLMIGRARSAFYAFATVLMVALIELTGTSARVVGLAQTLVAVGAFALSLPFTLTALQARSLKYGRALVYHAGLLLVAVAGIIRTVDGVSEAYEELLATGALLLIGIALSNSWQLVLSHESDGDADPLD
jgi:hypothetical protein